MAEKKADDGWQVVTSRKRKPSAAKDDQTTAANKSSETGSKGRASLSASAPKGSVSSASKSKGPTTSSKSKSKDPDTSIKSESEGPKIGLSEFVSSPASTPLVQAASDASPTTPLSPATEIEGHSLQALRLASGGAISPTKSHDSMESTSADDGFITAKQTPEPSMTGDTKSLRASPSSSETYDSAEEGGVLSHQEHEPSETAKGKEKESFEGPPAIVVPRLERETPASPSATSPDTASLDQTTPKAVRDLKRHVITQAQSADTNIQYQGSRPVSKDTNNEDELKESESKDSSLRAKRTAIPVQVENQSISEMSSAEHNITNLETVPPQSGSENPDSRSSAELTSTPPMSSPKPSSPVKPESPDDPRVQLASEQPSHPPTISQESSRQTEMGSKDEIEATAEGPLETVIDYGVGPLGHTVAKDTIQTLLQPSASTDKDTIHSDPSPSKLVKDKDSSPSSSTLLESKPLDIDPTSITTSSSSLDPASLDIDPSATAPSSSSATMSTPSKQTASGSAQTAPETKDEETTPKPKFAQLASIPESEEPEATTTTQSATMTPSIPRQATSQLTGTVASSSSSTRGSPAVAAAGPSEFANFINAVDLPEIRPQEVLTPEEAQAVVPRMNAHERALTGTNIVTTSRAAARAAAAAPSRPSLPPRSPQVLTAPPPRASRRRSHAIPIRAPLPEPGFARPAAPLQPYVHGIIGVPSHYIPMYGACHGMFFDPVTRMFVGDGPPRPTARRADGSYPCTTQAQLAAEPVSQQPVNPEDALHIQTAAFLESVGVAAARAAQNPPPALPLSHTPTSVPTRPFKSYFCRCTGTWLARRHDCPEPARAPLPSGLPIRPGTVLPRSWYTHELIIDASIYPGGVIPELGSEAALTTSAVGGGAGEPAQRWFAPAAGEPVPSAGGAAPGGAAVAAGVAGSEGSSTSATAETHGAGAGEEGEKEKKKKRRSAHRKKNKGKGRERPGDEGAGEGQGEAGVV